MGSPGGAALPLLSPLLPSRGVSPPEQPSTALPSLGGAGPCAAAELACDSGECIAADLGCDFAATCADGSDETRCGERQPRWHGRDAGAVRG